MYYIVLHKVWLCLSGSRELLESFLFYLVEVRREVMEARLSYEVCEESDEVLAHVDRVQRVRNSVRVLVFVLELVIHAVVGVEETRQVDASAVVEIVFIVASFVLTIPLVSAVFVILLLLRSALQHGSQLAH